MVIILKASYSTILYGFAFVNTIFFIADYIYTEVNDKKTVMPQLFYDSNPFRLSTLTLDYLLSQGISQQTGNGQVCRGSRINAAGL